MKEEREGNYCSVRKRKVTLFDKENKCVYLIEFNSFEFVINDQVFSALLNGSLYVQHFQIKYPKVTLFYPLPHHHAQQIIYLIITKINIYIHKIFTIPQQQIFFYQ